ncbi:putative motility protein [Paenisporosarcina cavernae]|uniref:Putative motility protein n=1 Tax=Paenisporosarcina cavernae TaxID=2320858 RepID=A0A385YTB3_9BACL|nr:putative motility protein [Paenisporosarcina cavernae]AYC29916.1 putative motility protein [Paenisporosarcina cavernae]
MELSSMMASSLRELQQTVQMSVMQNALNMNTASAVQLLQDMPATPEVSHPYKGTIVDISG